MIETAVETLGDYKAFYAMQAKRLYHIGINIQGLEVSHVAFRTNTLEDYRIVRQKLETICSANVENIWNGRPISKLLLKEPLVLAAGTATSLIELIPPAHQHIYKMGLEHVGIVIGDAFEEFGRRHARQFTGQQDQGPFCQPFYITFPDHTNVKFYRLSLQQVCILEGKRFDGFTHAVE